MDEHYRVGRLNFYELRKTKNNKKYSEREV